MSEQPPAHPLEKQRVAPLEKQRVAPPAQVSPALSGTPESFGTHTQIGRVALRVRSPSVSVKETGMLCHLEAAHKQKKQDQLQPCDTEYPVFVYQPAIREANGIIECGACQKRGLEPREEGPPLRSSPTVHRRPGVWGGQDGWGPGQSGQTLCGEPTPPRPQGAPGRVSLAPAQAQAGARRGQRLRLSCQGRTREAGEVSSAAGNPRQQRSPSRPGPGEARKPDRRVSPAVPRSPPAREDPHPGNGAASPRPQARGKPLNSAASAALAWGSHRPSLRLMLCGRPRCTQRKGSAEDRARGGSCDYWEAVGGLYLTPRKADSLSAGPLRHLVANLQHCRFAQSPEVPSLEALLVVATEPSSTPFLCCRVFVVQQIPNSNLLLLVTDPTCDCSIFPPVVQEATEVKYILQSSEMCGVGARAVGGACGAWILSSWASLHHHPSILHRARYVFSTPSLGPSAAS
ncbi:hypothetical protein P7K49_019071 [Saguinus oedipus]|uniref:Uncharacterized protein n=1 Tax=Saguinus oedipus TaxID=9490 RepID=A0ABQ9UWH5_SAGOE|nr:hypothetical protein P7K49_019071 [Saguinus oedipus]